MEDKNKVITLSISAILLLILLFIKIDNNLFYLLGFLAVFLLSGYEVLATAVRNIFKGEIFDENFLMTIAGIGAFCIGEYAEGAAVMLLYGIGELLEDFAVMRSRRSITKLMNIRPDYARIKKGNSDIKVDPNTVNVGDVIVIHSGEKIPLDGTVISGSGSIDNSALTGESVRQKINKGDLVLSGCVYFGGVLEVMVQKVFGESTASVIINMALNAASKKTKAEKFISKFARVYTPVVVIMAVLIAFVPPIFLGFASFSDWLIRALVFLVISCPCALVISVPLSFFAGIGGASKKGILIKGSIFFERLARVNTVVFDKTGTLTAGRFSVTDINPVNISSDELLKIAATAEFYCDHPIALSLKEKYAKEIDQSCISNYKEIDGRGVCADVSGKKVIVGNARHLIENEVDIGIIKKVQQTTVYVAVDGQYKGCIEISDAIKENSEKTVDLLKKFGIKTAMLTGDKKEIADFTAKKIGIDEVHAELLPMEKIEHLEKYLDNKDNIVAFVGDGINDAPVIARADVGIAMGARGSDAAIEAADVVLMNDDIQNIVLAIKFAKKTRRIAKENIIFAITVKAIILLLGVFGCVFLWLAVLADVGVALLAILNAMRSMHIKGI